MQIVIDIPEKEYKRWQDEGEMDALIVRNSLVNGTPLPKGHGRLIDADALEKRMLDREVELKDDRALWESSAVETALDMFAPTIIEADSEVQNDKRRIKGTL